MPVSRPFLDRRLVAAVAGGLVAGLLHPALPAAAAAPVRCGATLRSSTTLSTDLVCAGDGLTLAPGVRLDLGGHRLIGHATGTGVRALASTGTTVRNGTVQGWKLGIEFEGATPYPDQDLVLSGLTVRDAPVRLSSARTAVDHVVFVRSELGLYENYFTATASTFDRSSTVGELNQVTVKDSTVRGAGLGVDENNIITVVDSTLDGTGFSREAIGCYGGRSISGTTIRNYPVPMYADNFCPTVADRSTFTDHAKGVFVVDEAGYLVVTNSAFRRNAFGVEGLGVTVTGSTFDRNGDGVHLTNGDTAVLASDTFTHSTGSGVRVDEGRASIGNVRADGNAAYGIYAPGASDLGGNRARSNGTADCVGVVCTP